MRQVSNIVQLLVSLSVAGLFWLIYPGVMVVLAITVALIYVAAAIGAIRGNRLAEKAALAFTLATTVLAFIAVLRFIGNGFRYQSGNFELHDGFYWPPCAFLAIAIGAVLVVVLRLLPARKRPDKPQS